MSAAPQILRRTALGRWELDTAPCTLIAARENAVYRVDSDHGPYAFRVHRLGYRTHAELVSELAWMNAAAQGGLSVPAPVAAQVACPHTGSDLLHVVQDRQVDLLTWLDGAPLAQILPGASRARKEHLFHTLGESMAKLHDVSDAWHLPAGFTRCHWDSHGLLGSAPLWGRFWDNPSLNPDDRTLMQRLRSCAQKDLAQRQTSADTGLIHADLVAGNVLIQGRALHLIDFDDGGYGDRVFDVATALLKHRSDSDYLHIHDALLAGYQSRRPLDVSALPLFFALRAATYVGWNITRRTDPSGAEREARFIDDARSMALAYLNTN